MFGQAKVFRQSGSELELLYRQAWSANERAQAQAKPDGVVAEVRTGHES